jgi:fluoroacetyl-CoA thioesterase
MRPMEIPVGASGSVEVVVADAHTAPSIGSGKVRVLATPVMINLIEAASLKAIEHLLDPGYQSLGTHLDVHHVAATPVGMKARATAVVTNVDGRTVTFKVEARDEKDLIGHGTHQRVVVNVAKFDARVQKKLGVVGGRQ